MVPYAPVVWGADSGPVWHFVLPGRGRDWRLFGLLYPGHSQIVKGEVRVKATLGISEVAFVFWNRNTKEVVEMSGLEPPTPTLRTWCSPS